MALGGSLPQINIGVQALGRPVAVLNLIFTFVDSLWPTSSNRRIASTKMSSDSSIRQANINVALFSYTRAFGDGPRNFEPWSSD
ncbi:hypothetical protein TNCV_3651501 [Trichonephila clavipes]|nr:hypothetical protein TNCV_3651501 [Trichonephila clavipes]